MARYALVIGITNYDDQDFLRTLTKPAKDAEAIAQFLESTRTFENVKRLPEYWISEEKRYKVVPHRG